MYKLFQRNSLARVQSVDYHLLSTFVYAILFGLLFYKEVTVRLIPVEGCHNPIVISFFFNIPTTSLLRQNQCARHIFFFKSFQYGKNILFEI